MPKIIDNIEEKIFRAAFKLFSEKGYDNVSMEIIAEEVGIAVGTLYNYHSNKRDLFLKVLEQSFKQTYSMLNNIIDDNNNTREFITVLYDETVRIKQFIEEIIENRDRSDIIKDDRNKNEIRRFRENLLKIMSELISKIGDKKNFNIPAKYEKRIIRILLMAVANFAKEFPDEREENIDFITNLIFY